MGWFVGYPQIPNPTRQLDLVQARSQAAIRQTAHRYRVFLSELDVDGLKRLGSAGGSPSRHDNPGQPANAAARTSAIGRSRTGDHTSPRLQLENHQRA